MSTDTPIPPSPKQKDYATRGEYFRAYDKWWKKYRYRPKQKETRKQLETEHASLLLGFEQFCYLFFESGPNLPAKPKYSFIQFMDAHPYLKELFLKNGAHYRALHEYEDENHV